MDKDVPSFVPSDALNQAITTIAERSQRIVSEFLDRQSRDQSIAAAFDPLHVGDAFLQMTAQMLASPVSLVEAQMSMWSDYMQMWQNTADHLLGAAGDSATATAAGKAAAPPWRESDVFDFIKQTYLLTARWIQALVKRVDGLDEDTAQQVDFYTRQFIDAMDPASLFANNPSLLQITIDSKGENPGQGLDHLLSELERSKTRLSGPKHDGYEPGVSVALSEGMVAFRNETMELLSYAPAEGARQPLAMLIVPPWSHKFYAVDLRPANSLVQWAVSLGHHVFVISWCDGGSPSRDLAATIKQGPLAALDAIAGLCGDGKINGVGFGMGGTLLAATQALLAAKGNNRINSASYLASLMDFSESGEFSVFIAEEQLRRLDDPGEHPAPTSAMANLLRANDLIWSFVIDSFHGERAPFPFDLLLWNADSLKLPAALQHFYLHDLYQHNLLAQAGGLTIDGVALDLGKIVAPCYVVGMNEDHLAPWQSVFAATRLLGGPVRFVRAGSGHLSGLINPPALQRHGYWTNSRLARDANGWAKGARSHDGSWWEDWQEWLVRQSGPAIKAPPRQAASPGPAPGKFVRRR